MEFGQTTTAPQQGRMLDGKMLALGTSFRDPRLNFEHHLLFRCVA